MNDATTDIALTIVTETPGDATAIERLHERTFGPGRYAKTAYRLREQVPHALGLSFTARTGTLLVGSVRLSPIRIGDAKALLLGPLTVEPVRHLLAQAVGGFGVAARTEGALVEAIDRRRVVCGLGKDGERNVVHRARVASCSSEVQPDPTPYRRRAE